MQKSVNDTAIELIPKVKFSEKVRDYRLIFALSFIRLFLNDW